MTNSAWAIDGQTDSAQVARQTSIAPLAVMGSAARPVGARSGVRFGSGVVATVTSTTWTVKPHVGIIDAQSAATAGPYGYAIDTNVTGSINAAGATARTDVLWVRIDDPVQDGTSTPAVTVGYTASSSTPPARAMVLGTISVPASGGGAPTFVATHPWLPTVTIPVRTQAERDALPLTDGLYVDRLDLNIIQRCDGTAWRNVVDCFDGTEVVRWGTNAGSTVPAGTPKKTVAAQGVITTTPGGAVVLGFSGLTNVVSMVGSPSDTASNLGFIVQSFTNSSATGFWCICRDVNGAPIVSAPVRISVIAVGY